MCNAYAPVPLCFYPAVSGTDTFNLSSHILHVGEKVTGTYRWLIGGQGAGEFAASGSVSVGTGGPGLKLIDCHGPRHDSNAEATYGTPRAFDVTKGHTTCEWKAVSATDAWENGPALVVDAGGQVYPAGDFYAVVGKGGVIEGHVTEQNVKKQVSDLTGIPGAKVRITGPHGYVKTVTTSDTGYYNVSVGKAGSYTVTPTAPARYFKGAKKVDPSPEKSTVDVKEDETAEADFTYKSTLKLTLDVSRKSVPADGESYIDVKVTATDAGAPAADQSFSLRPSSDGRASQSAWRMPVPATICTLSGTSVGSRVWPDPSTTAPNTDDVKMTTDSDGVATLRIYTGTVPGRFPLTVWALDNAGKLITQDTNSVSADADIAVKPLSGNASPATTLHDWLNQAGNEDVANSMTTNYVNIATTLADDVHSGNLKSGFVFTPVNTAAGYNATLVSPAGSRVSFDPATGEISLATQGGLIEPYQLIAQSQLAGSYWGYLKTNATPAPFPTLTQWLNNSNPDYASPDNTGPISPYGYNPKRLQYLGFGYDPSCT